MIIVIFQQFNFDPFKKNILSALINWEEENFKDYFERKFRKKNLIEDYMHG